MSDQGALVRAHVGTESARERSVNVQLQMPLEPMEALESHATHVTHAILLARVALISKQQRIRDGITRVL